MANLEKINRYRTIVQNILSQYASYKPSHGDIEVQAIFDTERDHYQVLGIGWDGKKRVFGCSMHLDIKDGKIWIQLNNTEVELGEELVEQGVPKEDIVIGFQPTYIREISGYAVA
jgi:hypothetical protein